MAITSHPEKFTKADALKAGRDGYLVKLVSTRTLPRELSDVVEKIGNNRK